MSDDESVLGVEKAKKPVGLKPKNDSGSDSDSDNDNDCDSDNDSDNETSHTRRFESIANGFCITPTAACFERASRYI